MLQVMNSNSWFPTLFDNFFNTEWMPKVSAATPAINVKEDASQYTMELAVPGIKKEFCRVHLNADGNLQVAIENKMEHKEEKKEDGRRSRYLRREFSYTNYEQTYILPENVEKDKIEAHVDNGVLTIILPKQTREEERAAQRQIEVK